MQIRKRNGTLQEFKDKKIEKAIKKAWKEVRGENDPHNLDAFWIAENVVKKCLERESPLDIEDIQDIVEDTLIDYGYPDVAKGYIRYRYKRELGRSFNENLQNRYLQLSEFIKGNDEEANKENSNKDTRILSTMRDYIAGFTCRELATEVILPPDIAQAHKDGIIHFHDSDYSPAMPMSNCCLINLEDMLQNGTVISGVKIEKPHSFHTACTITTQIIAAVASSQYGTI